MALWRIKRPEALKEHSPADLGRVLGLHQTPEVKTLRRKPARLAAQGPAAESGRALAQRRVAQRRQSHERIYHQAKKARCITCTMCSEGRATERERTGTA